jgi:hypothetical protein
LKKKERRKERMDNPNPLKPATIQVQSEIAKGDQGTLLGEHGTLLVLNVSCIHVI